MSTPFYSVEQCQQMLTALHKASLALAEGKSVSFTGSTGGHSLTRMSADEIETQIKLWESRLDAAQRSKKRNPRIRLANFA